VAIDADPARTGKFMEVSATPIVGPQKLHDVLHTDTLILVSNPNHLNEITSAVGARWDVALPADLPGGTYQGIG
jgi:hypothetical protein